MIIACHKYCQYYGNKIYFKLIFSEYKSFLKNLNLTLLNKSLILSILWQMNWTHKNNFIYVLFVLSFAICFPPFEKNELEYENWHCFLLTLRLTSGEIWEAATLRQLSNLSTWGRFLYGSFTVVISVDKCSQT